MEVLKCITRFCFYLVGDGRHPYDTLGIMHCESLTGIRHMTERLSWDLGECGLVSRHKYEVLRDGEDDKLHPGDGSSVILSESVF